MGSLDSIQLAQKPAVASPQPEEDCLLVPLKLVDAYQSKIS